MEDAPLHKPVRRHMLPNYLHKDHQGLVQMPRLGLGARGGHSVGQRAAGVQGRPGA